jgi:hypothetical protein
VRRDRALSNTSLFHRLLARRRRQESKLLVYTVKQQYDEFLVYVHSVRFPDDTALIAVFATEDAANEYVRVMNSCAARPI